MRHKIKIVHKLLIFGIAVLLSSCSEDLYEPENTFNKQGIKISKVSLKEPKFQNKTNLIQEVNKIKSKQVLASNANRMVFDSINNFYFDDENGMLIENINGYESYTFKVERETPIDSKLENVIFSKNQEGGYDTYLAKYPFSDEEIKTLSTEAFENMQTDFQMLNRAVAVICITITTYGGCNETHSNGYTCSNETATYDCYNMDGGSGGGGSSGSGSNTGGSGNGSGTGTTWQGGGISTTPTGGGGSSSTPTEPDPCTTLSEAKNNNKVQTAIDDLKTKTTGEQEFAYEIERKRTDYTPTGSTYNTILHSGGNFGIIVPYGIPVQGQAHNHPINGVAIPSWDDIYWTQLCEQDNGVFNNGSAFNTIVSPDPANPGGTILYSITIDNIEALQAATAAVFNLPKILAITDEQLKRDAIMEKFKKIFAPLKSNTDAQEKTFLQTFASYGITLSKFNDATQKWEKLKLDPTNQNNVIKQPCN